MTTDYGLAPLARWDGLHLVLHLPAVEALVRDLLRDVESLSDPRLSGCGDTIGLAATVRVKGIASRVEVELREIRVRMRRFGFRIGRVRSLWGVRVPRALVETALSRAAPDLITVIRGSGIGVVDLRRWIPPELDLKVVALLVAGVGFHLWLGPGSMVAWPAAKRPALGPGDQEGGVLPDGA
jgi:hypothetical protein